nr:MAG TPA: hypothetical protein [Caudoviricetes sp.]
MFGHGFDSRHLHVLIARRFTRKTFCFVWIWRKQKC